MLYQTQPSTSLSISSFHFFHHLSPFNYIFFSSSLFLSPFSLPLKAVTEMECVQETALKSSFRKELTPQTFLDELSVFNAQNIITSTDDFFVDDLLNFSHEEHEEEALLEKEQPQPQQQKQNQSHQINEPSFNENYFGSLPTNELSVPVEEAANLEWLSYFVEDSFSEFSNSFPIGKVTEEKAPEPKITFLTPCFKTPVPAKARSKRTRTGVRVWPLKSTSLADSSSTSSSNNTTLSSSSTSSPSSSMLICITNLEQCSKPPEKKTKRKASFVGEGRGGGVGHALPRRCSHCGVQKTPQWRTGPLGAKTLCNACGVRYKSGRLLPEYRPACSPSFSSELHSNHHRKVLEMRRKKDEESGPETGSVFPGF